MQAGNRSIFPSSHWWDGIYNGDEEYSLSSFPSRSEWFYRRHIVWKMTGYMVCLPSWDVKINNKTSCSSFQQSPNNSTTQWRRAVQYSNQLIQKPKWISTNLQTSLFKCKWCLVFSAEWFRTPKWAKLIVFCSYDKLWYSSSVPWQDAEHARSYYPPRECIRPAFPPMQQSTEMTVCIQLIRV